MKRISTTLLFLGCITPSCFSFASNTVSVGLTQDVPIRERHSSPIVETVDMQALDKLTRSGTVLKKKLSTHVKGDYDGDGIADFVVRDPVNASFYIQLSKDKAIKRSRFGLNQHDIPLTGDFDGDNKSDIAIRRTTDSTWYINRSSKNDTYSYLFGLNKTDIPVPADYDGDGITDVAIRRPETRTWFIRKSSTGEVISIRFGLQSSDIPVPADYDGDGKDDIAVLRKSNQTWFILNSSQTNYNSSNQDGIQRIRLNISAEDIAVPADYDGDGIADIAIRRPSTQVWQIRNSSTGTLRNKRFGVQATDIPVPADYDGDGKADIAVRRASNQHFYVENSSGSNLNSANNDGIQRVKFGRTSDLIPVLAPMPSILHFATPNNTLIYGEGQVYRETGAGVVINDKFILVPAIGHQVASIYGCEGQLRGNIFEVSQASGTCSLTVEFNPGDVNSQNDSLGPQKLLVAMINFPDESDTSFLSLSQTKELILQGATSANRFLIENSYGKTWLEPTFIDWTMLSKPSTDYFSDTIDGDRKFILASDIMTELADKVDKLDDYDRALLVIKDSYLGQPGCVAYQSKLSLGVPQVFNGYVGMLSGYDMGCMVPGRIEHELGHTFGFGHPVGNACAKVPSQSLLERNFDNDCDSTDINSAAFDSLGSDRYQPMYTPAWREKANWLSSTQVETVSENGIFTLHQSSNTGVISNDETQLIKVQYGTDGSDSLNYYLELRAPLGTFDPAAFANNYPINDSYQLIVRSDDANKKYVNSQSGEEQVVYDLIDYFGYGNTTLDVDKPFVDKYRDISFTVVSVDGQGSNLSARIQVEVPRTQLSPSSVLRFNISQPTIQQVTLNNISDQSITVSSIALSGALSGEFSIANDTCSNKNVQSGHDCALDVIRNGSSAGYMNVMFTLDDGDHQQILEVVAEEVTQDFAPISQWQPKSQLLANIDWYQAQTHCLNLEYDGKSDWRVPSIDELRAELHFKQPPLFELIGEERLWSASSAPGNPANAFVVNGNAPSAWSNGQKTDLAYVICAR